MTSPLTDSGREAVTRAERAVTHAATLATLTGRAHHDVAVVLGSGWKTAADSLSAVGDNPVDVPLTEVGLTPPGVAGHEAVLRSVEVHGRNVLIFFGRIHAYEGHSPTHVVESIQMSVAAGCEIVVLTNAAGGLREGMRVGKPVLIADHINTTGRTPLIGPEFVNLVDAYDPELRALVHELTDIEEGVYAMMPGPQYETPAEIRMLRTVGADLVGMSTVYETIAARAAGARVLGLSLVTNLAAGITGEPLNHEEVLEAGQAAAGQMGTLLAHLLERVVTR